MNMINVTAVGQIPKTTHHGVLVRETITIPGDERSRSAPGHGYPEHSVTVWKYMVFATEDDCKKWVANAHANRLSSQDYVVIKATPLEVTTTVEVQLK